MALITLERVKELWVTYSQAWTGNPRWYYTDIAAKNKQSFKYAADQINQCKADPRDWIAAQIHLRRRPNRHSTISPKVLCEPSALARHTDYLTRKDHLASKLPNTSQSFSEFVAHRLNEDLNTLEQLIIVQDREIVDIILQSSPEDFSPYFLSIWGKVFPDSFVNSPQFQSSKFVNAAKWLQTYVDPTTITFFADRICEATA